MFRLSFLFLIACLTWFPTCHAYNASQVINFNCTNGQYCLSPEYNASQKIQCIESYYCPGNQSAQFCPQGWYCPTPVHLIICPDGSYCPPASVVPRECSSLEYCPSGSDRYINVGGIGFMIVIIPVAVIAQMTYNKYQSNKQKSVSGTPAFQKTEPLKFQSEQNVAMDDELTVTFEHLRGGMKVNGMDKIIIDDISGQFTAGRLTAIMGPSGAGKTSLFSTLMGKVPLLHGTVRINHKADMLSHHRHTVGMVPQDDTMISSMTVHDILKHSANVRMPTKYSQEQRETRVNQVISLLGLSHVKHTVVGDVTQRGISGGEKKRVNIGIELVASPKVLFLDEPTTGLDSTTSIDVTRVLRSIASLSVSVVAVIHQPRQEIFNMLDDLLLLAPGGKTVYFGPAKNTIDYFTKIGYPCPKNINPADYFIDVISGKEGLPGQVKPQQQHNAIDNLEDKQGGDDMEELAQLHNRMMEHAEIIDYLTKQWNKHRDTTIAQHAAPLPSILEDEIPVENESKQQAAPTTPPIHHTFPNLFTQTYLYTRRSLLQLIRNGPTIATEMMMHLFAGLVIGVAFVHQNWFIPPLEPSYTRFCPAPMRDACLNIPIQERIVLMVTYTVMALGLTAAVIGNRNFGQEKANFFRESETGMSTIAYFIGKCLGDLPLITLYSFVYAVAFMTVAAPASTFNDFYACIFLFECCLFALGYVSSILFSVDESGLLCSVVASLLGGLGVQKDQGLKLACWGSWFGESLFTSEARLDLQPPGVKTVIRAYADGAHGFDLDRFSSNLWILFIYAMALRVLAYVLLIRQKRAKLGKSM